MQSKSTFPARIAPFSVLEPLPFSRVGLRKARFERETWTLLCIVQVRGLTLTKYLWQPIETPFLNGALCTKTGLLFFKMVPKFFTTTFIYCRIGLKGGKSSNPLCSLVITNGIS